MDYLYLKVWVLFKLKKNSLLLSLSLCSDSFY